MVEKSMYNSHKSAFSIAEALATMLIISLVIMLTAPLFTKPTKKNAGPHGKWECRLDEDGNHYIASDVEDAGYVTDSKDACIFKPPKFAKNFSVTVIGGGGGGAAATIDVDSESSDGDAVTFEAPFTGKYNFLLIGGGGGSGARWAWFSNCQRYSGGGAAGGVRIVKNVTLTKGKTCYLVGGAGGLTGDIGDDMSVYRGENGGTSTITCPANGVNYSATGGQGGRALKGFLGSCNQRGDVAKSGTPRHSSWQDADTDQTTGRPGTIFIRGGASHVSGIAEVMGSMMDNALYGHGGSGTSVNRGGNPGMNGLALISYDALNSGGGGQSGNVVYKTFDKLAMHNATEIIIKVGQGGAGGVEENRDGEPGDSSSFGGFAVAAGGAGGQVKGDVQGGLSKLAGLDGSPSPFGGTLYGGYQFVNSSNIDAMNYMKDNNGYVKPSENMFGAGGGGGGARKKTYCSVYNGYQGCWGKGGRGSSGIVRVEWN